MQKWTTNISLQHLNGNLVIENVRIKRGIFQGDSLSPLLFCLAIDPLSKIIKREGIGYSLARGRVKKTEKKQETISHLLFMDDLKLYAENERQLQQLISTVKEVSDDIGMEFGLDKCAKCTIRTGKKVDGMNLKTKEEDSIQEINQQSSYKYLGIEENANIEHKKMRETTQQEYIKRIKKICRTSLKNKHKITAINQLALPVLTYGFGVVEWPQRELNSLDIKTRKILTMHKVIYRNQCMDRVYLPRAEGGLGLMGVDDSHRATVIGLAQYLTKSTDPLLEKVKRQHDLDLAMHKSITKLAACFQKEFDKEDKRDKECDWKIQYVKDERERKRERWRNNQRAGR